MSVMNGRPSLEEITRATERVMAGFVSDDRLVNAFAEARTARRAADPGAPDTAPLVPNLSLATEYAGLEGSKLRSIADSQGASMYRGALHAAGQRSNAERQAIAARRYQRQSVTDPLTGLANRRSLDADAERLIAHARRTGEPVHAYMIDIDRFKDVNDTYGHAKGDEVLTWLADALRTVTRTSDIVGRYGGEEFSIFASDVDRAGAHVLAERLRSYVEQESKGLLDPDDPERGLTLSVGIAMYSPEQDLARESSASIRDRLYARADEFLYAAKTTGRNRIVDAGLGKEP